MQDTPWLLLIAALALAAVAGLLIWRRRAHRRRNHSGGASRVDCDHPPRASEADPADAATEMIEEPAAVDCPTLRVGCAQAIGMREKQEDTLCYSEWLNAAQVARHGFLAALADGIGGLENSEQASQVAIRDIYERFPQLSADMSPADKLLDLAACAHKVVRRKNQEGAHMGTTLVSVLISGWDLYLLAIGDSRIYLQRAGALLQLNRVHVYGAQCEEMCAFAGSGEKPDQKRARALTAYLGQDHLRAIDRTVQPMRLLPGDRVLLMSDGVFGSVNEEEMASLLTADPAASANAVIAAVEKKNIQAQDNASIVVICVE